MSTQSIVWWIVGLVVLAGGAWLTLGAQQNESATGESMMNEESSMQKEGEMMEKEGEVMMEDKKMEGETMEKDAMKKKGSYEAYSAEKLVRAQSGDVVLFFRASWCPTCKALDANIRSNLAAIPEGLTILDVDYDNSQSLKQKYGVTYQHTFVQVDSEGNLIKKWSGSPTLASLVAEVQ